MTRKLYTPQHIVDENGYSKFQMWVLMKRFGHMCSCSGNPPFDTDVLFEDRYLEEFGEG